MYFNHPARIPQPLNRRDLLARHGIEPSMSRAGNCWDNAVVESFFSTLKRAGPPRELRRS
jgi:transposase InsO family protein